MHFSWLCVRDRVKLQLIVGRMLILQALAICLLLLLLMLLLLP
jgi:hypothetical protein